jgi:hypothetical protein
LKICAAQHTLGVHKSIATSGLLRILVACTLLAFALPTARAADQAADEREGCIRNLHQIYDAIQAYQADHKDIPNWLADLVPQYLQDPSVLVCPVCRRTGQVEIPALADPKIATSYLFEFCPLPLGSSTPNHTRREWKRRQMGLVGSVVPIVRCRHHNPVLNLAYDGKIYDSPSLWETTVSNRVSMAELTPERIFANETAPSGNRPVARTATVLKFDDRDPKAPANLLDLTPFYNASLTESWHGNSGNDLSELPRGLQTTKDAQFDIRGIVQLGSKSPTAGRFPSQIKDIPVHQKCRRIHFLHSAGFGAVTEEGKLVATYVVHYATNQMRLDIPVVYGKDVRNWHLLQNEPDLGKDLKVAWAGQNSVSRRANSSIRLFETTWTNLVPDLEIESIDCNSAIGTSALFIIAITLD